MIPILFQGDGGIRLRLLILGYERQAALDFHDANWLSCVAELQREASTTCIRASIQTSELAQLATELSNFVQGEANRLCFQTLEETISLHADRFVVDHAAIACRLRSNLREHRFTVRIGRVELRKALSEVEEAAKHFPVRRFS